MAFLSLFALLLFPSRAEAQCAAFLSGCFDTWQTATSGPSCSGTIGFTGRVGSGTTADPYVYTVAVNIAGCTGGASISAVQYELPDFITGTYFFNTTFNSGCKRFTFTSDDTYEAARNALISFVLIGNATGNDDTVVNTAACNSAGLPVELTSFSALTEEGEVTLQWETASETNNAGFEVQQQVGDAFETIGFVPGHGTTTEGQAYTYRSSGHEPGRHVFRLKQMDYDGAFEYSQEVEVTVELASAYLLSEPFPNPFNPTTNLTLMVAVQQQVTVEVYDMLGQRVAVLQNGVLPAQQARTLRFDAASLPSGVYMVRAIGETFKASRQVLLVK